MKMLSPLLALLLYTLTANSINACGTTQKTNITAEVGDSVDLVCSWNDPGSSWIGNDGDGIDCSENSKERRCTIETIGLENDQDQLEMTLISGSECLIKCIFTLVVITPKLSQSLITATESAGQLNTATINASAAPSTSTVTPSAHSASTVASTAAATTSTTTDLPPSPTIADHPTNKPSTSTVSQSSVVVAIVSVAIVIITIALLISGVLLWLRQNKRNNSKTNIGQESNDTGFLIGPERNDLLFRDDVEFSQVVVEELIHKGTFTLTHQAVLDDNNVTAKRLKANAPNKGYNELNHEITVLKKINKQDSSCGSLPVIIGATHPPDPLCLIVERLPSHDLKHFLKALVKGPVPPWYAEYAKQMHSQLRESHVSQDLMNILIKIAEGEKYLCDCGITHGNLSTGSVLVGHNLTVKLCDFLPPANGNYYISTERGEHLQNMAPESIKEGVHTSNSEAWAFGILMFRLGTLETRDPFNKIRPDQLYLQIENGMRPSPMASYSKEYYRQIQECLKFVPDDRPSFHQVLHTLQILSENSSQHLLLNISSKKKGYIDETGSIYIYPLPSMKKQTSKDIIKAFSARKFSGEEATSGLSTTETSGVFEDFHEKKDKERIPRTLSSLVSHKKSTASDVSLSDFEQKHLMKDGIQRNNPLANQNII